MSDRELLEAAAKAEGREGYHWLEVPYRNDTMWGLVMPMPNGSDRLWNPLTKDGDAFRLAVKLRMRIGFIGDQACVDGIVTGGVDANEMCRRAIVRAAALSTPGEAP